MERSRRPTAPTVESYEYDPPLGVYDCLGQAKQRLVSGLWSNVPNSTQECITSAVVRAAGGNLDLTAETMWAIRKHLAINYIWYSSPEAFNKLCLTSKQEAVNFLDEVMVSVV